MWRVPYFCILLYRRLISPFIPATCRFHPTCSNYSAEAFKVHGFFKGTKLTLYRLVRCNPWNTGGYDPVPPKHGPDPDDLSHLNGEPDNG